MNTLLTILILIVSYVAHIFACRYFDMSAVRKWEVDGVDDGIKNETTPGLWFIPVIGLIFTLLFALVATYHRWKETPNAKWFFGKK